MPTIITHSVVAACSVCSCNLEKETLRLWILSIICSSFPDIDVVGYRYLYIPTYEFLGHRGFFHSPFFAALLSIFIVRSFYRQEEVFSRMWWKYILYFFLLTARHGILDALTNGGNGIALLSPITNQRFFFPLTPIEVSPLSIKGFFSQRGLVVILSEMVWVWVPCLIVILMKIMRKGKVG